MRILIGSLLALFMIQPAFSVEEVIPADKEIIIFESIKKGNTTFKHKLHADMTNTVCATCHHTYTRETPIKPCGECHEPKKTEDAPSIRKAVHMKCQGCHQYTVEQGKKAGPLKKECKLCHIKE